MGHTLGSTTIGIYEQVLSDGKSNGFLEVSVSEPGKQTVLLVTEKLNILEALEVFHKYADQTKQAGAANAV